MGKVRTVYEASNAGRRLKITTDAPEEDVRELARRVLDCERLGRFERMGTVSGPEPRPAGLEAKR